MISFVDPSDSEITNQISNSGVPLDVTRRLRIEGHNPSLVGGNVWHDILEGGATKNT